MGPLSTNARRSSTARTFFYPGVMTGDHRVVGWVVAGDHPDWMVLECRTQTLHGTAVYAYIGVFWGVNVGMAYMECLGSDSIEAAHCSVFLLGHAGEIQLKSQTCVR